jgi:hypothetical protein
MPDQEIPVGLAVGQTHLIGFRFADGICVPACMNIAKQAARRTPMAKHVLTLLQFHLRQYGCASRGWEQVNFVPN